MNEPIARVLVPVGMLGGGFPAHTVRRGIALGADVIAVDGGSTDSGPYYLATGAPKTTDEAVTRDLRMLLGPARAAGIPLIIGSCGTSGTDDGVDWVASIVQRIANDDGLRSPAPPSKVRSTIVTCTPANNTSRSAGSPLLGEAVIAAIAVMVHLRRGTRCSPEAEQPVGRLRSVPQWWRIW